MTAPDAPPLRYLTAADVDAAMPPLAERLRLAERTMTALVDDAELPPKIGVHPRPDGSFAHAMPAHLRGADPDGADDLLGIKWIAGFPANRDAGPAGDPRARPPHRPARPALPIAILDAGPITAERTAAISGVAIARFAPAVAGRAAAGARCSAPASRAGATWRSSATSCPGVELTVFDRHRSAPRPSPPRPRGRPGIGRRDRGGERPRRDAVGRRRRHRRLVRPGRPSASR